MARKPKKRKYTKRSAFWNKPVGYINKHLKMPTDYRVKFEPFLPVTTPKPCTKPYASRTEAALAARNAASPSQPYVCATCGEWHARLRA